MINKNDEWLKNYVKHSETGKIFKVIDIDYFGFDVESKDETTYIEFDEFEPIEVTESILLQSNFKKVDNDFIEVTKNGYFGMIVNLIDKTIKFGNGVSTYEGKLYLHKLQSLYRGITLKELNVNL